MRPFPSRRPLPVLRQSNQFASSNIPFLYALLFLLSTTLPFSLPVRALPLVDSDLPLRETFRSYALPSIPATSANASAVGLDALGNRYICGTRYDLAHAKSHLFIAKLSHDDNRLVWLTTPFVHSNQSSATALIVHHSHVFVTGATDNQAIVLALNKETGAPIWNIHPRVLGYGLVHSIDMIHDSLLVIGHLARERALRSSFHPFIAVLDELTGAPRLINHHFTPHSQSRSNASNYLGVAAMAAVGSNFILVAVQPMWIAPLSQNRTGIKYPDFYACNLLSNLECIKLRVKATALLTSKQRQHSAYHVPAQNHIRVVSMFSATSRRQHPHVYVSLNNGMIVRIHFSNSSINGNSVHQLSNITNAEGGQWTLLKHYVPDILLAVAYGGTRIILLDSTGSLLAEWKRHGTDEVETLCATTDHHSSITYAGGFRVGDAWTPMIGSLELGSLLFSNKFQSLLSGSVSQTSDEEPEDLERLDLDDEGEDNRGVIAVVTVVVLSLILFALVVCLRPLCLPNLGADDSGSDDCASEKPSQGPCVKIRGWFSRCMGKERNSSPKRSPRQRHEGAEHSPYLPQDHNRPPSGHGSHLDVPHSSARAHTYIESSESDSECEVYRRSGGHLRDSLKPLGRLTFYPRRRSSSRSVASKSNKSTRGLKLFHPSLPVRALSDSGLHKRKDQK